MLVDKDFDTAESKTKNDRWLMGFEQADDVAIMKQYKKGSMLFSQGDPVNYVYIVKTGRVKIFCLSEDGKTHTFEILADGHIVGAGDYLLGGYHKTFAEVMQESDIYLIAGSKFDSLLLTNPGFSFAVIRELARKSNMLTEQISEHAFMDVQERLLQSLARLADDYGRRTKKGVKIDLALTHEVISEMLGVNRSTITTSLNRLKKQGFLWEENRRLVIMPPEHIELLYKLRHAVIDGDEREAYQCAKKSVEEGIDPMSAMEAITVAINQVDKGFITEKLGLPDVVSASYAMKQVMPVIEGQIIKLHKQVDTLGKVIIGTAYGDIHDIGKTLVATLLTAAGFQVIDLGVNVHTEQYISAIKAHQPDIVAISSLMTSTVMEQASVINAVKMEDVNHKVKILVGGGAMTREFAGKIGADGYELTAQDAVNLAKDLLFTGKVMKGRSIHS